MDTGLARRCAIVCAASKGLGKASALALAREGAHVLICARTEGPLLDAAREIQHATGATIVPTIADVSRADDVNRIVAEAIAHFGAIDILVTNTGGPKSAPFAALSDDDWSAAIDSVLMSAVRLTRAVIPHMRRRGGGRIIHVTSVSVKQPIESLVLSNALRAAVTGLARTTANELAAEGILVNCVAPGYTRTDRVIELSQATAVREGTTPDVVERRLEDKIPMGRLGRPAELGDVVAFLASARAAYITGATIQVDGGFVRSLL